MTSHLTLKKAKTSKTGLKLPSISKSRVDWLQKKVHGHIGQTGLRRLRDHHLSKPQEVDKLRRGLCLSGLPYPLADC